jgi:hypothetical protein
MWNIQLTAAALALAACTVVHDGTANQESKHHVDAAVHHSPDASPTTSSVGSVTCYTEGDPGATCTLPVHCCFGGYSSDHDGFCTTQTCNFGTITCDGPEDCAAGERCCAHAFVDPDFGTLGYMLACQASACGAAPDEEICHPASGCSTAGASCVTAYGNDNDLPRTLYICR